MGISCGQTVAGTKDIGEATRLMAMENSSMLTGMYMKVNGLTIRHMAKALTHMPTEHTTMGIGLMISSMDMVWRVGLTVPSTRVSIEMAKKMASGNLPLQMEVSMKVSLEQMKYVGKESISGQMASSMKAPGRTTRCMD